MEKLLFPTEKEIVAIGKFVKRRKDKDVSSLKSAGLLWTRTAWDNKFDYEVSWLGVPIIQNPYDMLLMQELIFKVKPDVLVETGVAHGGSLIYYSSLLELLGKKGKVIGIDVDIRAHNRKIIEKHPMVKRITLLEGSSTSAEILSQVKKIISPKDKVLVCLDSDHHKNHVYAELDAYKKIVSPGSYIVVFDTFTSKLKGLHGFSSSYINNTPMEAIDKFLPENRNFRVDKYFDKFFVSSCPGGFLKRLK